MSALTILAIIYAVASPDAAGAVGRSLGPHQTVPAEARGLLLPGRGTIQLGSDHSFRFGVGGATALLERGEIRAQSDEEIIIQTGEVIVTVGPSRQAWIRRGEGTAVCAPVGGIGVAPSSSSGPEWPAFLLGPRQCWSFRAGQPPGQERPIPEDVPSLREEVENLALPPLVVDHDKVIGSADELRGQIQTEWGDVSDQGPRRDAQSCGCSEGGGGWSGGGGDNPLSALPRPDRLRPVPGRLRVRIRLPEGDR